MTVQAAPITDLRAHGRDNKAGVWAWVRGISLRQVRLATGLVLFAYILSHYFNHALGNISYVAMQAFVPWHTWFWRSLPVNTVLYTAAMIHFSLGLWALYQRRHFHFSVAEISQLVLGLSIPLWLASHFGAMRVAGWMYGVTPPDYGLPIYAWWVEESQTIAQTGLLLVAWAHGCIGLYFWLRMKPFYRWASPLLLSFVVLMPVLALLGVYQGGREVIDLAQETEWRQKNLRYVTRAQANAIDTITLFYFPIAYAGGIVLVFVARGARALRERGSGLFTLTYPDRQVRVPKGMSVLEASLRFNIPHASVCGGRARCSTCRVRIVSDAGSIPAASGREAFVLARVGAADDPSIRLACQLRPQADIAVVPILQPTIGAASVRSRQRMHVGEERYVVSMFVDMRGSTALGEARLAFDVVVLINRFVEAVSRAVTDAGGQPNQFVGDGVLALFGLGTDRATACQQALRAAALVAANVNHLNEQIAAEAHDPVAYGIGIHAGEVIVGDIGFRGHTVFTALGDSVNVAARLQDMTKALACKLVVSDDVCKTARLPAAALPLTEVEIRGRDEKMMVRPVKDPAVLAKLLDSRIDAGAASV
jgi:adenylate cyclase